MTDVVCLGELLIDFVSTTEGVQVGDAPAFEKKPGGAPANVAVGLARLGVSAAFAGKVGHDAFGDFLRRTLVDNAVDVRLLAQSHAAHTTLAFVSLGPGGERSFVFYRNPGADTQLEPSDIDASILAEAKILHFGSLSLTDQPARSATLVALAAAEHNGLLISYDPNLREALWPTLQEARSAMLSVLPLAHLLKVSEEESCFLTGATDPVAGAFELAEQGPRLVCVTRGADGCVLVRKGFEPIRVSGFPVKSVDTTGAGDAFVAAMLAQLLEIDASPETLESMESEALCRMARFANAAGALTTTRKGAIPAMPTRDEIQQLIASARQTSAGE